MFDVVKELRKRGIMDTSNKNTKAVTSKSHLRESMSCVVCDKIFFPSRKDARFCSAKCRKFANRHGISGRGLPHAASYDIARKALYKLAAYNAQNAIKSLIISALELLTDENKKRIYLMLREYRFED
jgi:hypothetical protein